LEFKNGESYIGAGRFFNCKFYYCYFENLTIVATKQAIDKLKKGVTVTS